MSFLIYPPMVRLVPGIVDASDDVKGRNAGIRNIEEYASSPDESGLLDYQMLGKPPPLNFKFNNQEHVDTFIWSKNCIHGRPDLFVVGGRGNPYKRYECSLCGDVFMVLMRVGRDQWSVIGSGRCVCFLSMNHPYTFREIIELKYENLLLAIFQVYNYLFFMSGKLPLGIHTTIGTELNAQYNNLDSVSGTLC